MVKYIVLCIFVACSYLAWTSYPVTHGPGIVAENEPKIRLLTYNQQSSILYKDVTLEPVKNLSTKVRVLNKKRYYFDDYVEYAPIDFVVGWNDMSDERNLDHLNFKLSDREYEIEISRPPFKISKIYHESALFHLIPSTKQIYKDLHNIRNGHILTIDGFIVNLKAKNTFDWNSLEAINDREKETGYIIWVKDIDIQ